MMIAPRYLAPPLLICFLVLSAIAQESKPGCLSNPGFTDQAVKSVFFFSGNWRNGVQFYDFLPTSNTGLYTVHPSDSRHLGWSESLIYREYAVQSMIDIGFNVINMSYWGLPGTNNWAYWAPMQSSTGSHDQLVDILIRKKILFAPYIESFAPTDLSEGFSFSDDFPGTEEQPSPKLVEMIEDLVDRYLVHPTNELWPSCWATVYDQDGTERYLVSIIHVASNQNGMTDKAFARGFDSVAAAVFESTGIKVGFALDILPVSQYAPGSFKATPSGTGNDLYKQKSVLAVQCFLPEIWKGMDNENMLSLWKKSYLESWKDTGIPLIHDLSSGYDAHILFPSSPIYGNNQEWRDLQSQVLADLESESMTFNSWNGYTEGMAGMPTLQYGESTYRWLYALFGGPPDDPTGLSGRSQTEDELRLYPNPFSGTVHIHFAGKDAHAASISLFTLSGKLLKSWEYTEELYLGDIVPGSYLLRIVNKEFSFYRQVVKTP